MSPATLFTGHRIDAPDRPAPRFPARLAPVAKRAIVRHLAKGRAVSSAANGGDILFLEACAAQRIAADIFLPMPVEDFLRRSVSTQAPGGCEARSRKIWSNTPEHRRRVLTPPDGANPFAFCNQAMLSFAQALPGPHRLIALWNGEQGDGHGGASDMVAKARDAGFDIVIIDPGTL